ncbi:DUF5908 family protein [Mucilaginibacter sp. AK015]|uniref:DUF5908 family protein n=1 Tax=Mucilaginibacter sp. AK015 TaxID=2723072 RepID=UPI0016127B2F|nr:DUF5908 family protein [Mucilaginibacter sp. AK015]MBB5395244.1 hypothetical protein [Mucilaginibacter sp. AK015]
MAIEIRELVIKTQIVSGQSRQQAISDREIQALKRSVIETCREMIRESKNRYRNNR